LPDVRAAVVARVREVFLVGFAKILLSHVAVRNLDTSGNLVRRQTIVGL
jgi:hypothetical protein